MCEVKMFPNYANVYYKFACANFYLWILVSLAVVKVNSVPPELTFIINKQNASHVVPICIGEGEVLNSAIAWIYPLVDNVKDLPSIDSSYLPIDKHEYNCNFGKSKHCSKKWEIMGWKMSDFSAHGFKPILDSRWEGFPTYLTSNLTKEFSVRVDIPNAFQIGVSIRAARNAEVFICEGWNPYSYPCYYVNIGGLDNKQTILAKYKNGVPSTLSQNDTKLAKYKHDVGVLSEEEWKTFSVTLTVDGQIKLIECVSNMTILDYSDKNPLKPINIMIRSENQNALWKIHKNEYIFTTKADISKFGPELYMYGSQLCISLHIAICKHCGFRFFMYLNGKKEILKKIVNESQELLWEEIKLTHDNIFNDTVQIYVETYYTIKTEPEYGFWAIDDVRVCSENEIRITKLLLIDMTFKNFQKSQITCEVLKNPMWRPIYHVYSNQLTNVVCNSSTSTSIQLFWNYPTEDTYQRYSVIQYEGNDICKNDGLPSEELTNTWRRKSRGHIIGRNNHINVQNLVPYTSYNIKFWNVVDNSTKEFEMYTLPTKMPTKEEIPKDLKMSIYDKLNVIEWPEPKCTVKYGPIVYQIYVKNQNGTDTKHYLDISTKFRLDNLVPFTNYTIEIETARQIENFNKTNLYIKTIHNFTTKPGVAPKVDNLELYSTTSKSASLRFNVPQDCKGVPTIVQVRACHPLFLSQCVSKSYNLTKCELWVSKYCIHLNDLVKGINYEFRVSIKNQDTFTFSDEVSVEGKTIERIPGKPSNLTYLAIKGKRDGSHCNLNISWAHPYVQNGTITMFEVFLQETTYNLASDTSRTIHEILKVDEQGYKKKYSCVVNYISYDTPYRISVRAVNDFYKGDFEVLDIKTENAATYIDQTPQFINCTNETLTFKLPHVDQSSSTLVIIVQDYDSSKTHILDDIVKLEMFDDKYQLCNDYGESWVAKTLQLDSEEPLVVIGDRSLSYIPRLKKDIMNKPLTPDTEYCLTFAFIDQHESTDRIEVYHYKHIYTQRNSKAEAQGDTKSQRINAAVYVIPICILIVLIGCGAWFLRRRFMKKKIEEHIYESMPFDDYSIDAVSNESYDKLVHH